MFVTVFCAYIFELVCQNSECDISYAIVMHKCLAQICPDEIWLYHTALMSAGGFRYVCLCLYKRAGVRKSE